eukprot:Hpha_TRINITY_DN33963_c0_g1::TRINITY_DN33963_c0_g1_i1::g.69379::m.69379
MILGDADVDFQAASAPGAMERRFGGLRRRDEEQLRDEGLKHAQQRMVDTRVVLVSARSLNKLRLLTFDEAQAWKDLMRTEMEQRVEAGLSNHINAVLMQCVKGSIQIMDEESAARDSIKTCSDRELQSTSQLALRRDRAEREEAAEIVARACSLARNRFCQKQLDEALAMCREQLDTIAAARREALDPPDFGKLSAEERLDHAAEMLHLEVERGELDHNVVPPNFDSALAVLSSPPRRLVGGGTRQLNLGCLVKVVATSGGAAVHSGRWGRVVGFDQGEDPIVQLEGTGGQVLFYASEVTKEDERSLRLRDRHDSIVPPQDRWRSTRTPPAGTPARVTDVGTRQQRKSSFDTIPKDSTMLNSLPRDTSQASPSVRVPRALSAREPSVTPVNADDVLLIMRAHRSDMRRREQHRLQQRQKAEVAGM